MLTLKWVLIGGTPLVSASWEAPIQDEGGGDEDQLDRMLASARELEQALQQISGGALDGEPGGSAPLPGEPGSDIRFEYDGLDAVVNLGADIDSGLPDILPPGAKPIPRAAEPQAPSTKQKVESIVEKKEDFDPMSETARLLEEIKQAGVDANLLADQEDLLAEIQQYMTNDIPRAEGGPLPAFES